MSPSTSLNVITGETGAGKSIMLGALGLLIGNRSDKKALFDQDSKCIVEGTFDISHFDLSGLFDEFDLDYQNECIIRREITSAGKSRAFVNDTPTTLDVLKRLGAVLVDIHSQHDTLLLAESIFQLRIVDQYGGINKELTEYQTAYSEFLKDKKHLEKLVSES
ncbi:MAG: AAA family ATPase, partial [Cyclobacteriaceae bacterium]